MKGRYFLVVLSAVVCTVWSEAELQDCSNEELEKCLDFNQGPTYGSKFSFSKMTEEMDRLCQDFNRILRCYDSYTRQCMNRKQRRNFHKETNSTMQFIKNMCDSVPHKKDFLPHSLCMRKVSDDLELCVHQYGHKFEEVQAKIDDLDKWQVNEIRAQFDRLQHTFCCSSPDLIVCLLRKVTEKCGVQTAKSIEDDLHQKYLTRTQDYCKDYQRGSDKCQDSSASRKLQRALLLPMSLAMLSLYALRST